MQPIKATNGASQLSSSSGASTDTHSTNVEALINALIHALSNSPLQNRSEPQSQHAASSSGAVQSKATPVSSLKASDATGADAKAAKTTAPRADVMIGSYVDPQNLASQKDLAKDPRIGLFSNQIGFVKGLTDPQRNAVLDTFKGKDMTIERASYDNYGPSGTNGLHDQFTRHTDGKTNLNIQTADLDGSVNLSDAQSAANVKKMENDIRTQKALGNTLIPVVQPNTPPGQKESYAQGFASPQFDAWRSLAKQAGGLMFDSPPDLMANTPGYAKFNQDATRWLHENGLKSYWYAAAGGHDPNYQANVEKTVQTMNATHTNPDQYILSGYSKGDAQGTVAAEAKASRYILEHTKPV